jgi:hypothetical protein
MNSSPATSHMPATGGRFGVCLLPYPRREISWGERHPLRRETCAARGVHIAHAHVIRLADSQDKQRPLCGHTCGGNPALYFSPAKRAARALRQQDNELGAISVPRLMPGHERPSPEGLPRIFNIGSAVNNTRADQPGSMGAFRGTQANQRAIQNGADVSPGLQPCFTRGPRLGRQSVNDPSVSHAATSSVESVHEIGKAIQGFGNV